MTPQRSHDAASLPHSREPSITSPGLARPKPRSLTPTIARHELHKDIDSRGGTDPNLSDSDEEQNFFRANSNALLAHVHRRVAPLSHSPTHPLTYAPLLSLHLSPSHSNTRPFSRGFTEVFL